MELDFGFDDISEFDMPVPIDGFLMEHESASAAVKTELTVIKRYPRPQHVMYEYAEQLAKNVPDLQDGEAVYAVVSGNFIFGDFIEALLVEKNYRAQHMTVATLSLGQDNVDSLRNLQDGGFAPDMALIVSDYWYAHERRREGGVPYIVEHLGGEGFRFAAAGLHTKVTLIKTECGKHLVLHGSANLRSSRNLEQVCVENNRDLYEFNHAWTEKILSKFLVTGKSLRGGKVWQEVTEPTRRRP